jgi:outer membrane protein assembly factor BamB
MSILLPRKPATAGLVVVAAFVLSAAAAMAGVSPARGKVVAVDKRTGRPAWEAPLWSRPDAVVMPLVTDDVVYVLEDGKTLKALAAASGRPRWQAPVASSLPLTLVNDLVVAVGGDRAIAFNRWSGKRAWEFSLQVYPEWKFDENTIPVAAPGRLLLPARDTMIAIDTTSGQPCWAYTVTAAKLPLRPVVVHGMVYLHSGRDESPVALKLEDGLPNTGEYALPPDVARAIARARKADPKQPIVAPRTAGHAKAVFVPVRAAVAPGGTALAAAGAKRWRFPAPAGWTIDRVAGESAGELFALLEAPGK